MKKWSVNMNLIYSLIYMVITFFLTILIYKYFRKEGLYIWICISIIITNIESVKIIDILGLTTALGNITYSNIFLATDILNENEGEKAAKKSVLYGFLAMISFTGLMCFTLLFIPNELDASHASLVNIFSVVPRIAIASVIAYLISQLVDVYIFQKLKKKYNKLWLSKNGSTIIGQLVDTIIFVTLAYLGTLPFYEFLILALTTYVFKFILAMSDTGFIYIARKIKQNQDIADQTK